MNVKQSERKQEKNFVHRCKNKAEAYDVVR